MKARIRRHLGQSDFVAIVGDIFSYARLLHSTHAEILDMREERIFTHVSWLHLPGYSRSYVMGYMRARFEEHERSLVWTHVLNGVRVASRSFPDSRLREINPDDSRHCYLMPDGSFKVYFEPKKDPS